MEFCTIASGSSGNCTFIGTDRENILVDAGISGKRIEEGLSKAGRKGSELDAVLLTHEHIDHIKSIGVLVRKYAVPVYATEGTIRELFSIPSMGRMDPALFHTIRADEPFAIGETKVEPFRINHDAAEPVGYRLENGTSDSVSIPVAPTDLQVVWHTGGGTDRYVNYTVKNRHGQSLVSVRNAYRNGGSHHIANTCDLVGIEDNRPAALTIYPNPASDVLHVQAEGFQRAELMDMSGRTLITATAPLLDLSSLSPGAYFLRIITTHDSAVRRFIKK